MLTAYDTRMYSTPTSIGDFVVSDRVRISPCSRRGRYKRREDLETTTPRESRSGNTYTVEQLLLTDPLFLKLPDLAR